MHKIGILTGGGDCPGLNAVIRAVTKSAIHEHNLEVVGIKDGYDGLIEENTMPLTSETVTGILHQGGTILGTSNRADPYNYAITNSDGSISIENRIKDTLENIERLKLDGLIVIGGDGTLSIAQKLCEEGVKVIGVPKTIDNDLGATDVTFGFDSALSIATEGLDRLRTTAESHHRAMVLEVMGRYAGWIALRAGIAGGGDVILIPEIPYDMDKVCQAIDQRHIQGKKFSIIVVAEGAHPKDGEMVVKRTVEGSPDPIRLGGVSRTIASKLEENLSLESRVTILGHLQRGGTPTAYDRWLATRFGTYATRLLINGKCSEMVCLRGQEIKSTTIQEAVTSLRRVPPSGPEILTARSVGTAFGN
jgi:ATP-dependent phosphofructokinase / diphosphate-dependent phosphofructokinase